MLKNDDKPASFGADVDRRMRLGALQLDLAGRDAERRRLGVHGERFAELLCLTLGDERRCGMS
jgi:hypothetical protein